MQHFRNYKIFKHLEDELNPNRTILTLYMRKNKSNYPSNYPNNYPNNYHNQLSEIQNKILEIIKENPTISVKQISELINEIKYDAVRWNIAELKKKDLMKKYNIN